MKGKTSNLFYKVCIEYLKFTYCKSASWQIMISVIQYLIKMYIDSSQNKYVSHLVCYIFSFSLPFGWLNFITCKKEYLQISCLKLTIFWMIKCLIIVLKYSVNIEKSSKKHEQSLTNLCKILKSLCGYPQLSGMQMSC